METVVPYGRSKRNRAFSSDTTALYCENPLRLRQLPGISSEGEFAHCGVVIPWSLGFGPRSLSMDTYLALLAAIVFALGSMVFKRAFEEGAGVVHAVAVNNLVLATVFLPLLAIDSRPIPWNHWYFPVLTGAAFAAGHLLNVLSLRIGDVSVATPLLGSKVIIVAFLARFLFGWPLSPNQWFAAALTTAGVFLMGLTDLKPGRRTGLTTTLSLLCAVAFSLTDVMIQSWAGEFGVFNFLALQFAALALFSVWMIPCFGLKALYAPRKAWPWIFGASAFSAVQAILVTTAIGIWRDAASVNVVYATRGLWSVVFVWSVGHWIKNTERHAAGPRAMAFRSCGAALILVSVALAVKR
jgi:drug/metabolite transporter (DMT)-like permease